MNEESEVISEIERIRLSAGTSREDSAGMGLGFTFLVKKSPRLS